MPIPKPQEEVVEEGAPVRWEVVGGKGTMWKKDGALEAQAEAHELNKQ